MAKDLFSFHEYFLKFKNLDFFFPGICFTKPDDSTTRRSFRSFRLVAKYVPNGIFSRRNVANDARRIIIISNGTRWNVIPRFNLSRRSSSLHQWGIFVTIVKSRKAIQDSILLKNSQLCRSVVWRKRRFLIRKASTTLTKVYKMLYQKRKSVSPKFLP